VRQGFAEDRNIMFTYYFNVGVSVRLNSPVIYVKSTRDRSRENRDVRPIPGRTSTVVFAVLLTDLSYKARRIYLWITKVTNVIHQYVFASGSSAVNQMCNMTRLLVSIP
jgi:hypothetical protein